MTGEPRAPRTYAEWVALLERFRDGDDSGLTAMTQGSIEWTNVVAERWTRQVSDALNARLRQLSARLQRSLDAARGETFAISASLLDARRALRPLRTLASLPCLDERVHAQFIGELERWARETQESLEKSALAQRMDGGRLVNALRDNPLTAVAASEGPVAPAPPPSQDASRSRRIILQ